MRGDKRTSLKSDTKGTTRGHKRGVTGYSRKTALLEEAITQMNAGKYGRSSSALKELLALDPQNMEARRLFATLHLRLGSLIPARQAFDTLITEAFQRQDYWLAESLLREYLAAGPRCVPFLEKLGLIYQEKGDVQEAVVEYGKAIDILIEDPDPDNPHRASQLYKTVRDLAPASPIAIRLASLFDAQTGELLAPGPSHPEPATELLAVAEDYPTIPEPASGVMPWEIEPPQGEVNASPEARSHSDHSTTSVRARETDRLPEGVAARGQSEQLGEVPIQGQSSHGRDETTPAQPPEVTPPDKDRGDLPAYEEGTGSSDSRLPDAHPVALPSDLAVEAQAGLLEPGATGAEDRPVLVHGIGEPIQPSLGPGLVCTTEASDTQHVTRDHPASIQEVTSSTVVSEPSTVKQGQIESIPLLDSVQPGPEVAAVSPVEIARDIPTTEVSKQVSPPSLSEPWKEPGFSWEALFDRAWSFGQPSSTSAPDQATIQAKHEASGISERTHPDNSPIEGESVQTPERGGSAPFVEEATPTSDGHAGSTARETLLGESPAVEIPDPVERTAFMEEVTATGSLKPMPWDQVQESVLPILPAQGEASQEAEIATTDGHAGLTVQETPPVESAAVEIPDPVESATFMDEATSTGSMKPMPWDQVQESVLPILPAQGEALQAEETATTDGHADSTARETVPVKSAAVEIPEPVESATFMDEATSTGSMKPMPWDQVQDSVLPIPPAQGEELRAEDTGTTNGHAGSTAQEMLPVESEVVEIPEPVERTAFMEEVTATGSLKPMPWDQVQESVVPVSSMEIEASQIESTATEEERSTVPAGADEIVEVGQDQSPTAMATAPGCEEIEHLGEISAPAVPSSFDLQVNSAEATDSKPEASSQGVRPELSLAESLAGGEPVKSDERTEVDLTALRAEREDSSDAVVQTDASAQSLSLRLDKAGDRDIEQESAVSQASKTQEFEVEPIGESPRLRELIPSSRDEAHPVEAMAETVQEAHFSLVEEKIGHREEGTVSPQGVTTEDPAAALSPSPESHDAHSQWRMLDPMTAFPVEREAISEVPVETVLISPRAEVVATVQSHDDPAPDNLAVAEPLPKSSESLIQQEEWAKTSETIRFVDESLESSRASLVTAESEQVSTSPPIAISADDSRFMSSQNVEREAAREREVESPSRPKIHSERRGIGLAIQDFIGSCFSTTRAIVATCVGLILLLLSVVLVGIGLVGLTWVTMEEAPSPAYQSFTTIPQQTLSDFKKNGYFLLAGFDAPAQLDPIQAGYEGNTGTEHVVMGRACLGDAQEGSGRQPNASASVSGSWFRSADPVGQFRSHAESVRGWAGQQASALSRYGRWHKLPFEDWGYGQPTSLPCVSIIFAHELYLAEGFLQTMEEGVERLETDMEAWRIVLGQAKTLSVKTLALQAMNEDIAIVSGLLVRSDFDGKNLGRLTKMLRPLDQTELSIRWPMQSELVLAARTYEAQVKAAKTDDQSVYAVIASMLSLPKQRRLNDYAEYYEASYKAVGEGHQSPLPKWKDYIRSPASGVTDYMTNPIENIVGLEPLPPWDVYHGQVMDTEAHLRLASLQAWLRRGPVDGDLLVRLAKAGQKFYDPYTGLPMLVNMRKGALYSVGHDGKDQDADPRFDVVVTIPAFQAQSAQGSTKSSSDSSRP